VDAANDTVNFILSSSALGGIKSLSGVKIYVTTWDYDGGYRPLKPLPTETAFAGGDGTTDPLVMDDTAVIALP